MGFFGWEEESFPICCMIWRCGKIQASGTINELSHNNNHNNHNNHDNHHNHNNNKMYRKRSVVEADVSGGSHIVPMRLILISMF